MRKEVAGSRAAVVQQQGAKVSLERDRVLGRVEAFSDGVFAFAATLLVLGIRIPRLEDADASAGLHSWWSSSGPAMSRSR